MATLNYYIAEAGDVYMGGTFSQEAGDLNEKNFSDQIDVGETIVVTALTTSTIDIEEEVQLTDELTVITDEPVDRCFPMGGDFAVFVLQEQEYSGSPGAPGELIWSTKHSYTFTNEDQPKENWMLDEEVRLAPELMESLEWRTYDGCTILGWIFKAEQWFCNTDFLIFLIDYAASWIKNRSDTYDRRILFYPYGTGATDRYGETLDGMEVFFPVFPLKLIERHPDIDGREDAYLISNLEVRLVEALGHDEYRDYFAYIDKTAEMLG